MIKTRVSSRGTEQEEKRKGMISFLTYLIIPSKKVNLFLVQKLDQILITTTIDKK